MGKCRPNQLTSLAFKGLMQFFDGGGVVFYDGRKVRRQSSRLDFDDVFSTTPETSCVHMHLLNYGDTGIMTVILLPYCI